MPKVRGMIYIRKALNKEEKMIFNVWYRLLQDHFDGDPDNATEMLIHMACIDYVRIVRALHYERDNKNWKPRYAVELSRSLLRSLKALGLTPDQKLDSNITKAVSELFSELEKEKK